MHPRHKTHRPAAALSFLVALLALAAFPAGAAAADSSGAYFRAGPVAVMPTEDGSDDATGILLQVGGTAGPAELGLEFGAVELEAGPIDQRFIPLLASFRWGYPLTSTGNVAVLVGGAAGFSHIRVSLGSISDHTWGFTWSGDVLLNVRPAAGRFDFALGYKYLDVDFGDLAAGGGRAHALYATLGWRF